MKRFIGDGCECLESGEMKGSGDENGEEKKLKKWECMWRLGGGNDDGAGMKGFSGLFEYLDRCEDVVTYGVDTPTLEDVFLKTADEEGSVGAGVGVGRKGVKSAEERFKELKSIIGKYFFFLFGFYL